MNAKQYKAAIAEAFKIEAQLIGGDRKNTRLILRHMDLCSQIHAYDAERQRPVMSRRKVAA